MVIRVGTWTWERVTRVVMKVVREGMVVVEGEEEGGVVGGVGGRSLLLLLLLLLPLGVGEVHLMTCEALRARWSIIDWDTGRWMKWLRAALLS